MSRSVITPHPSHRLGRVGGERRCTRCWSSPTWDIIEDACPTEGGHDAVNREEHERVMMPPWSEDDLAAAYAAYMAGEPTEAIAARFGRTALAASNRIRVYRVKHGLPPLHKRTTSRETMAQIAAMTGSVREVALATGSSQATVSRARSAIRKQAEQRRQA